MLAGIERISEVIGEAADVSRKQSAAMADLSGVIQNVRIDPLLYFVKHQSPPGFRLRTAAI